MDFKLHQLSGSNIETIFNKAYLDAKLVDKDWCSIKGELEILIKAFEDQESLKRKLNIPTIFIGKII